MRIGFLQINPTIGAIEANTEAIIREYQAAVAQGAELVITPELAITGYPPRDLLWKSRFVPDNLDALKKIAGVTGDVALVVGHVSRNHDREGNPFYNSASVLQGGCVVDTVHKSRLPSYDVFDEARYFAKARERRVVEIGGRKVGITICEDIWTDDYLPGNLYREDPASQLVADGAEIIVNLSASPYHSGKPRARVAMLQSKARSLGVPIAYCNVVGGNDQLVFDGSSFAVTAEGDTAAVLPAFKPATTVIDLSARGRVAGLGIDPTSSWPADGCAEWMGALTLGVRDYVTKCGFKSVVLGLSGGIDSALVAAIAADALGPENVTGVLMPSPYSSQHSIDDALALCENLGIKSHTIRIDDMFASVNASLAEVFAGKEPDLTEENIQARLRGVSLMAISNKFGSLLLTTGNKSELAVGYCTIYGDMCGGLAVISDLPKTDVYALSKWINREEERIPWNTIRKEPSAELRPDQRDQDSLPEYAVLDAILECYVEKGMSIAEIADEGFDEETVKWIARRVDLNEWKRQQAAPGVRVTSKAFGMGRRIPIAQGYVGR
ncbi:NAD+ synthase [Sulfuriroseicoccus oceanibius]|uniref:Glutamine-dependent NAD(+) synthetase n=1 Tax=Sulfuriroseicoccus oceanibius TaxID=2707525 RepID=A0A6B3L6T0_9BACT|nr:NAD+ synthase [Sulfuriroseicoccus oceanibius]QQL43771.1 NAD+ synthase [Sulfuriroseicoccus oceanibius]